MIARAANNFDEGISSQRPMDDDSDDSVGPNETTITSKALFQGDRQVERIKSRLFRRLATRPLPQKRNETRLLPSPSPD